MTPENIDETEDNFQRAVSAAGQVEFCELCDKELCLSEGPTCHGCQQTCKYKTCLTTGWVCSVCKQKVCDFCSPNAELGSGRSCRKCFSQWNMPLLSDQ